MVDYLLKQTQKLICLVTLFLSRCRKQNKFIVLIIIIDGNFKISERIVISFILRIKGNILTVNMASQLPGNPILYQ